MIALKLILKIVIAPVILLLTLAIWICVGLVYVSGLVLGLLSTVIALLGVAVLITYSPQNGLILLVIAFLISPFGLPKLAFWLLGKVQDLKYAIQDNVYLHLIGSLIFWGNIWVDQRVQRNGQHLCQCLQNQVRRIHLSLFDVGDLLDRYMA